MLKTMRDMLLGALIAASVGAASALVGIPPNPGTGPGLVDGTWLNGLASGQNELYQAGIIAHAGGGQSACQSITPGAQLYEIDTVASSGDSICLPFAVAGFDVQIRNAGANSMNVFGQANNNLLTGSADTINGTAGSSAYAVPSNNSVQCFAAKNGVWSCVKGS